jgi:lactoylglutathione lyase
MTNRIIFLALLLALGNGTVFCQTDSAPKNNVGIQYLGHVAIGVSDLGRAMNFYCDQLGLTEVFRLNGPSGSPMLIYLRVNDNNFIELFPGLERQTQDESKRTGLRHLGFFVKDLQATLHTLQARGLSLPDDAFKQASQVRADGTFLYFIRDPDGNAIELSQITPDSKQSKPRR